MATDTERMRDAVWSVYFKRQGLRRSLVPAAARPIPAERALDDLLEHRDQNRGGRRRRAVLEAGAGDLHDPEKTRPGVAERVQALAGVLRVPPDVMQKVPQAPPEFVHRIGDDEDCVAVKTSEIGVHYDPRTHDSKLTVVSRANRPIGDMAPLMDPRNWKLCSDFFVRSDPVDPATLAPIRLADPARRWQLHEVFSTPSATFENLLNIEFTVAPERILVRYSLYESLAFVWLGRELPGVHERNSGTIEAIRVRAADGREQTQITTTKTIRYRDLTPDDPVEGGIDEGQWLNYCAPAMLSLWIDEASQGRLCCRHLPGGDA